VWGEVINSIVELYFVETGRKGHKIVRRGNSDWGHAPCFKEHISYINEGMRVQGGGGGHKNQKRKQG